MEKYTEMVAQNKRKNQKKVEIALDEMKRMFNADEQVVVCALVRKTKLSRAFFYNNETIHSELLRLQGLQEGKSFVTPQKVVLNQAMDKEIELLKKALAEEKRKNSQLIAENEKLKKTSQASLLSTLNEI